ncbi:unnamed protein product, partial [Iphiclides podalirius]
MCARVRTRPQVACRRRFVAGPERMSPAGNYRRGRWPVDGDTGNYCGTRACFRFRSDTASHRRARFTTASIPSVAVVIVLFGLQPTSQKAVEVLN